MLYLKDRTHLYINITYLVVLIHVEELTETEDSAPNDIINLSGAEKGKARKRRKKHKENVEELHPLRVIPKYVDQRFSKIFH